MTIEEIRAEAEIWKRRKLGGDHTSTIIEGSDSE